MKKMYQKGIVRIILHKYYNPLLFEIFSVLFRAKNPYINETLPYLIGSKLWNEKWHIGLIDSDDDDISKDDDADGFSTSSEDDTASLAISLSSNANTLSEFDRQSHVSECDPRKLKLVFC